MTATASMPENVTKRTVEKRPMEKMPTWGHWLFMPLFAVIQVFNTLAIGIILSISTLLFAVQTVLYWIPGIKKFSQACSDVYHDGVQAIADLVLKDPRDEPILAAVIGLTFTAVPVFLAQLWLVEINWYLVAAFYALVYGPNIRSFVRSFSAMHQDGHLRGGVFKGGSWLEKWTGNSFVYMYLAIFRGIIPHAVAHGQQHHRENTGLQDVYSTSDYDHTSMVDFTRYMIKEVMYQQFMITPFIYFRSINFKEQMRAMVAGNLIYWSLFGALALYSWEIAVLYMLVPWFASNFLMGVIHWSQHTFYGGQQQDKNYLYNTTTILESPENFLNEGYHVCHHHWKCRHWSEAPALYDEIQDEMRANQSVVFNDLSTMDLFLMLMLKRFDAMAKKLQWWDDISHEDKVALLKMRTKPVTFANPARPIAAHEELVDPVSGNKIGGNSKDFNEPVSTAQLRKTA